MPGFCTNPYLGRALPTAAAYRFFAQEIASQATISVVDREWIQREMGGATSAAEITERAGHVLAEVSNGLGIIVSPRWAKPFWNTRECGFSRRTRSSGAHFAGWEYAGQDPAAKQVVHPRGTGRDSGVLNRTIRVDPGSDSR